MLNQAYIGLRNLRRQVRRTVLTLAMVAGGVVMMGYTAGLAEGTYADMIALATRTATGHFQLLAKGYNDSPSLFKTIDDPDAQCAKLLENPDVVAVTQRVETGGLLAHGNRTTGVGLIGVDPETEPTVTSAKKTLAEGTWFEPVPNGAHEPMIIGRGVAEHLHVAVGDEVSFVSQAADGSIAAELYTVGGIIDSGAEDIDALLTLVRLKDAQELLELGDRVHRIAGVVRNVGRVKQVVAKMHAPEGYEILSWQTLIPGLDESITADRGGQHVFLVIIVIVVALGVMNTMMMAVLERTREFGVLMALGTTPSQLLAMTLWEAIWLCVVGVGVGVIVAVLLNIFVWIPYPGGAIDFGGVMIDAMYPKNNLRGDLWYPLIILAFSIAASVMPAVRASRLVPVEALRGTQ